MIHEAKKAVCVAAVLGLVLLSHSCSTNGPRYTPSTVVAPSSLEDALALCEEEAEIPAEMEEPREAASQGQADTVSLSLDEALQMALARNRELVAQVISPDIAETAIAEVRAAFDPTVSASVGYHEQKRPRESSGSATQSNT